ncbi:unnamed protein product [Mytilus edulis]|uniref:CCHC-type domain-containing protein n=1 Tax=Mytilus edulis TaxID=6550 RepID=A0A8S3TKB7_MYTED|nr:unnamed protein product [Mytilus edulis]
MQSSKGYMININTCPRVILTCIPGIGEAIATRIMAIREKGTHIDQDVLSQIPYMKVTEGTLGLIDFSPRPQAEVSELNGGRPGSVSMSTQKSDHVIIDIDPEECHGTDLMGTNISCILQDEAPPYCPAPRDTRTEDQKQIAHLQDFNANIRQWLEECDTQDDETSHCSDEVTCLSTEQCPLQQQLHLSTYSTLSEQSLCEPPQESLNSDRNACRSEYRTPSPRTNMVVRPQPDSQHDRDAQKQPDDRVFSPLTLDWNIPHPVVEDCHRQQEVQQTPPRYSPEPLINYHQQPRFLHTPTPEQVHFSSSVQQERHLQQDQRVASHLQQASPEYHRSSTGENMIQYRNTYRPDTPTVERVQPFQPPVQHDNINRQQDFNSPLDQSFPVDRQPTTSPQIAQLHQPIFDHSQQDVNQYQHGYNSPHRLEANQSQLPSMKNPDDVYNHHTLPSFQQHGSYPTNQQQGVNRVQQPLSHIQRNVQIQHQVQGLQQRLDQLQLGVNNSVQPEKQQHRAAPPVSLPQQQSQQHQVSAIVHQQQNYPEPRFQPPSSVTRIQQHKMIGHPTSMFQPPRGGPPPQASSNFTPYNQQYIPGVTYSGLGQSNPTGFQRQPLQAPYQQLPIPGVQQQPLRSGEPQPYYNQPSARPKEYNSDYYGRPRRSDPGYKYTGDSDTSDVSAFRHTRNKRRSEPEYNREDFSPIRSIRSSPLHRTRTSPRRFTESPSDSDTDGRRSRYSRGSRKKKEKIEKRQFLSSIPRTLRYNGKAPSPVWIIVSLVWKNMEKMMSTVTSLVQEKSARQELSPTSRSPNQDNRSSNYSPRRNYGRGRGRRNNSTDRQQNRRGYDTGECFYCHKQGHYKRNCPDLRRINNRQQTKQLTPNKNIQDERRVEFDDDNLVHDEQEKTSTGGTSVGTLGSAHLFRCVVRIQNKEVNALIDTGSEVTILKDSVFDALTQKPYIIRETTMHGAGRDMRMTC